MWIALVAWFVFCVMRKMGSHRLGSRKIKVGKRINEASGKQKCSFVLYF